MKPRGLPGALCLSPDRIRPRDGDRSSRILGIAIWIAWQFLLSEFPFLCLAIIWCANELHSGAYVPQGGATLETFAGDPSL